MPTPQRRITTAHDLAFELRSGRYRLFTREASPLYHALRDSPLPELSSVSEALRRPRMRAQCQVNNSVHSKGSSIKHCARTLHVPIRRYS